MKSVITGGKRKNARNDLQIDPVFYDFAIKTNIKLSQLKGLRVLELASVLAGPGVGQFFAELGAEVIKVENLKTGGDVTRTWKVSGEKTDDRSAYFCSVNWGKQSLALNLNTPEGQKIVHDLALKSDIVIASYKPGDAEKLRVDYAMLSKGNPGLIYGQISGYGPKNPRVGYDAIIQAEAGFMFMNGEPDGPSLKMPVALMDVLAGHHLKEGLLLAMLEKTATGKGKLVEVSLIESAVASLANQATNWLVAGALPQKKGSAHPNIAPYGDVFLTQDSHEVILAIGSDQQFRGLCDILKISDLASDSKFSSNEARVTNREVLNSVLSAEIGKFAVDDFMKAVNKVKIPAGIINSMERVMEMPEIKDLFIRCDDRTGLKTIAFTGFDNKPSHFLPPPHFGEHSREILMKFLNYLPGEVETLYSSKIIA
jgi:crotonobetainyl-CoA:carnitine CoA-transferase CaiB-like acyl-CoA transferase